MAALLASHRSSEGSLPPLDSYSPDAWQEDGSARSPRLSSALRLLPIAPFCGNVQFPMTKELLLAISPKLHDLAFTTIDPACGQIAGYDFDEDLQNLSCFLEAGSRSFKEWYKLFILCSPNHPRRIYESAHLYHSVIVWLKRHFTPDAARFDLRTPPGFLNVNVVGVLNLAQAVESFSLLSGAIFACCRLAVEDLTNGFLHDVGGKETLLLEDIMRVWLTRDRLIGACIMSATCVYWSKQALTCRRTHCRDLLDRIQQKTVDALHAARPSKPMHFPILQMSTIEWIDLRLCDACMKMVETREHEAREEIWSLLPCIVDEVVPGWAGKCPKHCAAFKPSEPLSDSNLEGSQGSEDCHMAGPVHDWMRYRCIRS
ncbi:hypothetical protein LXA43DRAFT_1066173 [Ganoderma leucocontextum]|nr:hypothetical protein LXA43DRAFT_1066173 [Ganoderma leucocontextum]